MEVSCPKCGNRLPLRFGSADEQGMVRLRCDNCRKTVLLKVSRRDLRLEADATEPATLPESVAPATIQPVAQTVGETNTWTLHVDEFPPESLVALRAVLSQVPRYSRNPNKVFDMTAALPYQFDHLTFEEVSRLEACLSDCEARYETAPGQ